MRFRIKGEKAKIKKCLDKFMVETKAEYAKQIQSTKTFGIQMPALAMGYDEDGDDIIFWDTLDFPKTMSFMFRRVKDKMAKNLKSFLEKEGGLQVEVKAE